MWAWLSTSGQVATALALGAKLGLFLGALAAVNHLLEFFADLRPPLPTILGVGMWAVLFLSYGAAGSAAYRRLGELRFAVLASVWSAIICTVITVLFASGLALLFMPRMKDVLSGDFAGSGMTDAGAYVIRNLFDAGSSHLLISPVVAVITGLTAAVIGLVLRRFSRRGKALFGCGAAMLLVAGVASIRMATSLQRSARPPYVLFGLLALGLSLASVYPVVVSLREPEAGSGSGGGAIGVRW